MADVIATWMGVPLSELPREKLCDIIAEQASDIGLLRDALCQRSIEHVRDLATLRRGGQS